MMEAPQNSILEVENINFEMQEYAISILSKILKKHLSAQNPPISPEQYAEICGVNSRTIRHILDEKDINYGVHTLRSVFEPMGVKIGVYRVLDSNNEE